jgi:exodeoxyribonuclease V beta subunit
MSFKPFLAYSASAGSGKTFALSVRYISLLFMGETPGSILAATFTNKAAAEMRQRVVDSLRHLGENEAFLNAVLEQTGLSREELFARQPEVLGRFLSSTAYIVTLDSFFSSILRASSLELGLEPDFVTREQGHETLEMHFLEEVQANGLLSSLVKLVMDIEDKRFRKLFGLMQDFYKVDPLLPQNGYAVKNMADIEEKIDQVRQSLYEEVVASGASKTAVNNFAAVDTKILFSKTVFEKESLHEHRNYKKYIQTHPRIETLFQELKGLLGIWVAAREEVVLHHLFTIYAYYRNANIRNAKNSGVLSFDDLTYFTYRLLHESISREFLYFKIDSRFKHILLDEFQDTSTLQFLLLKPLIDEIFSGHGQSEFKSFFYVGDTKQSLYRFRGGVEELFDRVAENYGIGIEQMDTNYRSAKHIIEQVNRWFEPVMPGYVPQKSREGAGTGYVEVRESEVEVLIAEAVNQAKSLMALGICSDDIAFLVNTNKEGQALQEACVQAGIETLLKTSSSLKNLPKIAALAAMVSYLFYGEKIDAEPLLQKVGKKLEEVDLGWFMPWMSPLNVLDRLIREFGYFEEDPNILKLLEFASSFPDILTFLEEFDSSSIAVASNSVHGAQIMTIHGSKGLEFPYVIILDKLTRPNSDKSPLILHYQDDLTVDRIFYRTKGREHFDEAYAKVMQERKKASQKDRMNVLYVALTRAVEGMVVIKKPKDSIFDDIAMEPMVRGALTVAAKNFGAAAERAERPEHISLGNYGRQDIAAEESEEEKDYDAILFGTALHYVLEMLGAFDEVHLAEAMNALQNRYGKLLGQAETEEIAARVRRLIGDRTFQKLLEGAVLRKEQSLGYEGELKQVDLLLEYEESALVVEYKSSTKYRLKHQSQVRFYQKAIAGITGKPTKGMIIYLLKDEIIFNNLN